MIKYIKTDVDTGGLVSYEVNTDVFPIVNVDGYHTGLDDSIYNTISKEYAELNGTDSEVDVDWDAVKQLTEDIASSIIVDTLLKVLSYASISGVSVHYPKAYNYSGDWMYFTVTCKRDEYEELKSKALADNRFVEFLKKYRSRSGFISAMAADLDEFELQQDWRSFCQVIMFTLETRLGTDFSEINSDDFRYDMLEEIDYNPYEYIITEGE